MEKKEDKYFVGVDVGTGSARAGVFDASGKLFASASNEIEIYRDDETICEQSSDNIWGCVAASVKEQAGSLDSIRLPFLACGVKQMSSN